MLKGKKVTEMNKLPFKLKAAKVSLSALLIFLAVVVVGFTALIMIPTYIETQNAAEKMGKGAGYAVGKAVGSFNGLLHAKDATEDGEEDGTSAKDTKVFIEGLKSEGRLEILVVNQKMGNFVKVGSNGKVIDEDKVNPSTKNVSYAILTVTPSEAVFTVNLSTAEISESGNKYLIALDAPEVEITKFTKDREVLDEYKNISLFSNAAEIGDKALTNAEIKTVIEAKRALTLDENLVNRAKKAAEKQVTLLVKALTDKECTVTWKDSGAH